MPRFFFDVYTDVSALDDTGSDLADIASARAVALGTLSDLTRKLQPDNTVKRHRVMVRAQSGKHVLEAVLTIQCIMIIDKEDSCYTQASD